jgi:hypothetical protein
MLAAHRHRLSTSTLQKVLAILRRAIRWGQARDLVSRNVAELVTAPTGAAGRPSNALALEQARAVLGACDRHPLGPYVTLALLVGVRNEELPAVTWDHVDLDGNPDAVPPGSSGHLRVALGPRRCRHQDAPLAQDDRPTCPVCRDPIARVVGHSSTKVTELVYRKQLRPVLTEATAVTETLFELPAADRRQSPD